MHVLSTTQVFPNAAQPVHGVFVRERLVRLADHDRVQVIAPLPYFPGAWLLRPTYRPPAPAHERHGPLEVWHPRFFNFPGILKWLDGLLYFASCRGLARRLDRRRRVEVVDAHFLYPDSVGAAWLAAELEVPLVITVRGGNLALFKDSPPRRSQVRRALGRARRVIALSRSLGEDAIDLGADPRRVRVVPNGVDHDLFRPTPRDAARRSLGLPTEARLVVSVGHVVPRKGFDRVAEVLPRVLERFPGLVFVVVGGPSVEGDARRSLSLAAQAGGVTDRVVAVGPVRHEDVARYLNAADVVCLPSDDEGCPNVVLEALACGTPVVASHVGGVAEILGGEDAGILVPPGDACALADALTAALSRGWDRSQLRARVAGRTWEAVAATVHGILEEAVAGGRRERDPST